MLFLLSSTAFAVPYSPSTTTSDDPMDSPWPMKSHDTRHTGRSPYSTADNSLVEKWHFQTDSWVEGGTVIDSNGIIYFGDLHYYFYAVHPDGVLKWKTKLDGNIWSTPALAEDGIIYIGTYEESMYALDSEDGAQIWRFDAQGSISSSPAIAIDGTIYFGTMGPGTTGRIYALNSDGTEKWHYETGYWIVSDPSIGPDSTIYIGSGDNSVYALNLNGTLRWKYETGDIVKGHPSIGDDGTVYISSFDHYLYAFYPNNGTVKWKFDTKWGSSGGLAIDNSGTIYIATDELYAINPDGSLKWSFDLGVDRSSVHSSPAISSNGIIYLGIKVGESSGGELLAVNHYGTELWRKNIANLWVESSPCIGADGTVYIGSSNDMNRGFLHSFGESIPNNPPQTPSITGPNHGTQGTEYPYKFVSTDPEEDDIYYYIDWGDSTNSGWIGPCASGEEITQWADAGSYTIRAKVRDYFDQESAWATLEITMPKHSNFFINTLLQTLFKHHPNLTSFLEGFYK
jgi:outer membrane protein assembly factor BamB